MENTSQELEEGFSLLETLIALAIMSLTSLVLMQSTSSMLSVSDKASRVSGDIVEQTIARKIYKQIVGGLIPSWSHNEEIKFVGTANEFSGLSAHIPSEAEYTFGRITVSLQPKGDSVTGLTVISPNSQAYELAKFEAGEVSFEYMSEDQIFYPFWPPETKPVSGSPAQILSARYEPPDLPQLIRLKHNDRVDSEKTLTLWVASVNGSIKKPHRLKLHNSNDR